MLAEKLGLDAQKLFDIASKSSGQCWSMTSYCPVPGPVPTSPANRDYQAGFTAAMMLKDLTLAQDAANATGARRRSARRRRRSTSLYVGQGQAGRIFPESSVSSAVRRKRRAVFRSRTVRCVSRRASTCAQSLFRSDTDLRKIGRVTVNGT